MVAMPKEIEIERMMNLVRGFGWEKKKEEVVGDELLVTLSKKLAPETVAFAGAPPS